MIENANNIENRPRSLFGRNRKRRDVNIRRESDYENLSSPLDGSLRAWLVMVCAFICIGLIFGLIYSYGIIYSYLENRLSAQDDQASSNAALIGSLNFGTTLFFSPLAGMLSDTFGVVQTILVGGVIYVLGLLLSSFFVHDISLLTFTYGFVVGFGASLIYTPTLSILGQYFKRYQGKMNGFVSSAASIFTVITPPVLVYLLWRHDLSIALRALAIVSCFLILATFIYEPVKCCAKSSLMENSSIIISTPQRSHFTFNTEIWKIRPYILWTSSCALALSGYYVPYVHMAKFVSVKFPQMSPILPIMCIGATSTIGRIIGGILADIPRINSIWLHQISLLGIGSITIMLPLIWSYDLLVILTLLMGLFDGLFFPVISPIAYELCGVEGVKQAISFFLGLVAVPLTVGPVLAGKIFDGSHSYTLPFILAGIPSILGALLLQQIRKPTNEENIEEIQPNSTEESGYNREKLHEHLQKLDAALQNQKPLERTSSSNNLIRFEKTSEIDIEINNDSVYSQKETTKRKYKYSIF